MNQATEKKAPTRVVFCRKCHTGYKTKLSKGNMEKCPSCSPNDFGIKKDAGAPRYNLVFAKPGKTK